MIELHNLYSLPNIIRMIKSIRMKTAGHAACMRKMRNTKFWFESLKRGDCLEDLGVDGKLILQ
jgi:hypothetical protein